MKVKKRGLTISSRHVKVSHPDGKTFKELFANEIKRSKTNRSATGGKSVNLLWLFIKVGHNIESVAYLRSNDLN